MRGPTRATNRAKSCGFTRCGRTFALSFVERADGQAQNSRSAHAELPATGGVAGQALGDAARRNVSVARATPAHLAVGHGTHRSQANHYGPAATAPLRSHDRENQPDVSSATGQPLQGGSRSATGQT